ncbi:stage III sporulation protein AE [Siminovitchia fortis]|uniref:Stage III sporulation protein AE n=1 Tax=Siminovitchia fortis TaxID=254758 RepID=A0A443J362_9BACI|nr:stage III sporulation protein AE [Siminovitchia fortis]RWR15091.1 stage III sporulation protein AE [Siminovitchia fortis]WHY82770.1 stage III sporulation protein AE [Siminovitchia fortis]
MRKTIQLFLFCFVIFTGVSAQAEQEEKSSNDIITEMVDEQIETLGIEELSGFWEGIMDEYGGYLPESQRGTLLEFLKGEKSFSIKEWFRGIAAFAFQELTMNGKLLGTLLLLTTFSAFLQSLHTAFEKGSVSKVAYAVVFMVLIIIALNSFRVTADYAVAAIESMSQFIYALIPLILALISSSGGVTSAAFFHPVLIFLIQTSGLLIQTVVLPLLFMALLLGIVSALNENYKVTKLSNLLKKAGIGILGAFMAVLLGVISIQGTATAVTDGVAIRTAKYVTGNFVPVVGRMFTDAADTVLTASVLIKNTVGLAGVAIILMIAAFPSVKILIIVFVYKLAGALLQPVGDGPIINCLDAISKCMMYVFASLAIVSFMFFLCITIVITSGNVTMMIR